MNKYYYQGILVRTSEHNYTHAVINTDGDFVKGKLISCSGSELNARKVIQRAISEKESNIRFSKDAIKALRAGKSGFMAKYGNRSYPYRFDPNDTIESHTQWMESYQRSIDYIQKYWKVVELEKR